MANPSILLVGNFSNRTRYAWNNIYRLFNVIAKTMHERGLGVCLSFAELEPPVEFIEKNIPFSVFEFDPSNITIASLYNFSRNIRKKNIKYIYFTDQKGYWWLYFYLKLLGVKKIIVHSRVSVSNPFRETPEKGLIRVIKSTFGNISAITPNRIYAVSDFVKHRLTGKNCLPENKIVVIFNGINIDKFNCKSITTENDKISVFAGARATKHKGIATLIGAVKILVHEIGLNNFIVHYAGDGPDIDSFRAEVRKNQLERHFIFLGELKDTCDHICNADVVVVPSAWGDAFPSAVSEALAAGKPLITTRAGGIPEIVGNDANAIVILPSDEQALATALASLINEKEKRISLGSNARRRAEEALDEKRYYQQIISQLTSDLF